MDSQAMSIGVGTMNAEFQQSVYDQMAAAETKGAAGDTEDDAEPGAMTPAQEAEILRDSAHPRWQEARDRFEDRLIAGRNDD
jgi:hypothetical protein